MQAKMMPDETILVKVAPGDAKYDGLRARLSGGGDTQSVAAAQPKPNGIRPDSEPLDDDGEPEITDAAQDNQNDQQKEGQIETDDFRELAEFYANHWNFMASAGMEPDDESLWEAEDDLEEGEWSVYLDDEDGIWKVNHVSSFDVPRVQHDRDGSPLRYAWVDHGFGGSGKAKGKKRWKNTATGRIVYQEKKPEDKSGRTKVLRQGPGKPRPEGKLSAADKKKAEKELASIKKVSRGGTKAKLGKMLRELQKGMDALPETQKRKKQQLARQVKIVEHQIGLLSPAKEPETRIEEKTSSLLDKSRSYLLLAVQNITGKPRSDLFVHNDDELRAIIESHESGKVEEKPFVIDSIASPGLIASDIRSLSSGTCAKLFHTNLMEKIDSMQGAFANWAERQRTPFDTWQDAFERYATSAQYKIDAKHADLLPSSTMIDTIDPEKVARRTTLLAEASRITGKAVKQMVKYSDEALQAIIDSHRKDVDNEQHTGNESVEGDRGADGRTGSGSVLPASTPAEAPRNSDAGIEGGTGGIGDVVGLPAGEVGNGTPAMDSDGGRWSEPRDGEGTGNRTDAPDADSTGGRIGDGRAGDADGKLPEELAVEVVTSPSTADNPNDGSAGNFRYPSHIDYGGDKAKFQANIDAIMTLRKITEEGRSHATAEEQQIMSKWVGWGQLKHVFKDWKSRRGWEKETEQIQALLGPEEFDAAIRSTQNAHYTHPDVVKLHWDIAKRLGFKGGKFLETSAGIGYYLGMMPKDLAGKTQTTAVEKDLLTGAMLEKLYPKAAVSVAPFEEFGAPDNFYDLVASNVPFGTTIPFDPKYKKYGAHIHDYFLLKSLDAAAEGGLVMHITSTGTMDKPNDMIRRAMAEKGDLVAAIRFPGKTHKENAGTEVVTDMLIFRKRPKGEAQLTMEETPPREAIPKKELFSGITTDSLGRVYHWKDGKRIPGPQWLETISIPGGEGEEPVFVNKHFVDNPEWVLGTIDRTGKMYRAGDKNVSIVTEEELTKATGREVERTEDRQNFVYKDDGSRVDKETVERVGDEVYGERLARAFEMLPKNVLKNKVKAKNEKELARLPAPGEVKDGGMFVQDGKLFVKNGSEAVEVEISGKSLKQIEAILNLRDLLRASYLKQSGGEDASTERAALNKAYDAYVKKYGFLNAGATKKLFSDDPDYFMLSAIEKWDAKTGIATKEAAFREDTVRANKVVTSAKSTADAMSVSLQQLGSLDIDHMAALTKFSTTQIEKELIEQGLAFNDPAAGWTLNAQYLSGNVRRKLVEARVAAATDDRFKVNVEALEKVQPKDIDYTEIMVKPGAPWVPASDIKQFLANHMQTQASNFDVEHSDQLGWKCSYSGDASWFKKSARAEKYAVRRSGSDRLAYSYPDLVEMVMKQKTPMITYKDENGNKQVDWPANEKAERIMDDIREKFDEWIWRDPERRTRLHRYYNDNFNNVVRTKYDGAYLELPGANPTIKLRPHQKNFVAQVIATGNALAAHEVGTGKAQPLDAKILTPGGWVLMGDVKVGDEVIAGDGSRTVVEAVFPQGEKEIFRVKFSDGSSTECCAEHLWLTQTYHERNYAIAARKANKTYWECDKPKVRPLSEIMNTLIDPRLGGTKNHSIPVVGPVQFYAAPVPLSPYVLGVLLGDGSISTRSISITASLKDVEIIDHVGRELPSGVSVRERDRSVRKNGVIVQTQCPAWGITQDKLYGYGPNRSKNPVTESLDELGLIGKRSHDKFIPDCYKFNERAVRIAVLQGLLDTDGTISRKSRSVVYYTVSNRLADDVAFLVQSLGGIVRRSIKNPTFVYKGEEKQGKPCHVLCLSLPPSVEPFRLKRKADMVVAKTKYLPARYIVEVTPVGTKPAQCIRVSHPSHLYVTDDFIVTHNTYSLIASAMELRRLGLANKPALVCLKANVEAITRDALKLYPNAKILSLVDQFDAHSRQAATAKVAAGDWDMVILTHENLTKIKMRPESQKKFIQDQIDELNAALTIARQNDPTGEGDTVAELGAKRDKLEADIKDLMNDAAKDDAVRFEELGIDALFVDECFPGSTEVITDQGKLTIEKIVNNQLNVKVLSCNRATHRLEYMPVTSWFRRPLRNHLVRVSHEFGSFVCTSNHNIWTEEDGYIQAGALQSHHTLWVVQKAVRCELVVEGNQEALQQGLLRQNAIESNHEGMRALPKAIHEARQGRRWKKQVLLKSVREEGVLGVSEKESESNGFYASGNYRGDSPRPFGANESQQSDDRPCDQGENASIDAGADLSEQGRERGTYRAAENTCGYTVLANRTSDCDGAGQGSVRFATKLLQGGHRQPVTTDSGRSGWTDSQDSQMEISRQEKNAGFVSARVVGVTLHQRAGDERTVSGGVGDSFVYDIEVEGNHNYFADGVNVSNCHKFKSLPIISTMGPIKGIPTSDSQRALNLKMMADWLRERNGGRGLVFATGTPLSNTMAELFIQQRFLQPKEMKERGIHEFDAWANTFGNITTEFEFNVAGGYKEATRFRSFINPKELVDMVSQVMDVQRAELLLKADGTPEIVRPPRKDEVVPSPQTDAVKEMIEELGDRAASLTRDRKRDNMFMICNDGRKGSIDMRMLHRDAIDEPTSKVNKCVENVVRNYRDHPGTTQMIFSDIGAHPVKNGFHLYGDIIKKLKDAGIKDDEIANFADMSDKQKEAAQEMMRQGKIRVAIGTTEKMGTGVNVQNRLGFIHHLDAPWTPAAMEQRNGRGWRQGNENSTGKISISTYVTEKSLDSMMWQTLTRKDKFIKQVMLPDAVLAREVEDEDTETFSADQILALSTGDDRVLEKVVIDKEIKKLERKKKSFNQEVTELTVKQQTLKRDVDNMKRRAEDWDGYANMVESLPKDFSLEVGGVTYDKLEDADSVFSEAVKAARSTYGDKKIATYKGVEIRGDANKMYARIPAEFGGGAYPLNGVDSARQLGGELGQIKRRRDRHYEGINETETSINTVSEELAKMSEFKHEAELQSKRARSAEITLALAGKTKKPAIDDGGPEPEIVMDKRDPSPEQFQATTRPDIKPVNIPVAGFYSDIIRYKRMAI